LQTALHMYIMNVARTRDGMRATTNISIALMVSAGLYPWLKLC